MEPEDSADYPHFPLSEVGCEGKFSGGSNEESSSNLLRNMEALLTRLMKTPASDTANRPAIQLVKFDPDEADADIEGWCRITEIIVDSRKLDGADLLLALTHALRGRAATCLTKLQTSQLTWTHIKELLLARFGKTMQPQDHFDEILKFQIETKETASKAAARLWTMIEQIPRTNMPEDIIVGFVASVLSHRDSTIRRELLSCNISTRAQLFRSLNNISLKRRHEELDGNANEIKRSRYNEPCFSGTCRRCGVPGHRFVDCRKRLEEPITKTITKTSERSLRPVGHSRPPTCFVCGRQGHVASTCPDRRGSSEQPAVKEVHVCERRPATGTLSTSRVSYVCITLGLLYSLPSSTLKLFSSENTTLNRIMTETEISLMGSISSASTLLLTPFCGYFLDKLGRKRAIIFFYFPQVVAWVLIAMVSRVEAFICAMFFCGLSGSVFLIVPVYVSEYCYPSIRGALSSCAFIFHGVGMVVSYLLGGLLNYETTNYTGLTMSVVGLILLCILKDSPLYLMKNGFEEEAAKSIAFFRGSKPNSKDVITEIENIRKLLNADLDLENSLEEEKLKPDENKSKEILPIWRYLAKSKSTRRAMCALLVLYTLTVFQGLVVVQIFAAPLFEAAIPSMSATLSSVLFAITTVVAGFFEAFLIDTVGRRLLLILTSIATGLLCVILGITIFYNLGPNWLSALFIYIYTITYTVGPGAVPNVLLGEIFLPDIKGFATMVCVEWYFLCVFIILFIFNPVFKAYGLGPLFFFFSCCSFSAASFTFFYLPETKGLPVDIIQRKFLQRKKF